METINKLLDKVREACSIPSDNALATRLGITRQTVSKWRNGEAPISDDRIAQLAHMAKLDGGKWLLTIHAESATGESKKDWTDLAKRLGAVAASLLVAALPWSNPAKAGEADLAPSQRVEVTTLHIMSLLRWLFSFADRSRRGHVDRQHRRRKYFTPTAASPGFSGVFFSWISWRSQTACRLPAAAMAA